MMAKISSGQGFAGLVDYANDIKNKNANIIASEGVDLTSNKSIVASFSLQAKSRPSLKNFVGHISLSFAPEDAPKLSDTLMADIAKEYLQRMGIVNTQYVMSRHHDKPHPHVHIAYNRVDNDGRTVSDRNDRYRSERLCKELTVRHGLYFASGKENVKEHRLREPDKTKYEIFHALRDAVPRCRDWPELTAALRHEGIATEFRMRGGTSDVQGVVFARNGYPFNGSKIDRQFSFSKIDHALSLNRRQALSANERGSVSNPVASFSHLLEDLLQPVYDADEERRLQERLRKKRKQHRL